MPRGYRPRAKRAPSKLSPIGENGSPRTLGMNYSHNNILGLLEHRPGKLFNIRTSSNVPNLGVPANRAPLQRIINDARRKYAAAKTNAARVSIYLKFYKNHTSAMNALKRKHLANTRELNALLSGSANR